MLQGYNIFEFYKSKEYRKYNNTDFEEYVAIFHINLMPPFNIVTSDTGSSGTFKLLDASNDAEIGSGVLSVTASGDDNILSFYGEELAGKNDGYYYYQVTFNGNIYYSDVFGWCSDVSELLELTIDSSDITLGFNHVIPLSQYTYNVYLQVFGTNIEPETNEDGIEKPYGDIPAFSTTSIIHNILVNGDNQVFRFLAGLRAVKVNGTIQITLNGVTKDTYDFNVEVESNEGFGQMMVISFKFKEFDFISSRNEI